MKQCQEVNRVGNETFRSWRKQNCARKLETLFGPQWVSMDRGERKSKLENLFPIESGMNKPCRDRALRLARYCAETSPRSERREKKKRLVTPAVIEDLL